MNTVRDQVTTLDLKGYYGNPLIVRFTVQGSAALPLVVGSIANYALEGKVLPSALQAVVGVSSGAASGVPPANRVW